jgi:hypothetical protein
LTVALWTTNAARLTIALLTTNSARRIVGWLKAILLAVPIFRPGAERVSGSWLCCRTMSSRNLRSTSPMARLSVTKNISYATNRQTTARERIILHGFICRDLNLGDDLAETVGPLAGLRGPFVCMSSAGQNTDRSAWPQCAGRVLLSSPKVAFDKAPYGMLLPRGNSALAGADPNGQTTERQLRSRIRPAVQRAARSSNADVYCFQTNAGLADAKS